MPPPEPSQRELDEILSRSLTTWIEEDFRRVGMLTRKALDGVEHPIRTPCRKAHKWDLEKEGTTIYLYCTVCQTTHRLQWERAIVENPSTML